MNVEPSWLPESTKAFARHWTHSCDNPATNSMRHQSQSRSFQHPTSFVPVVSIVICHKGHFERYSDRFVGSHTWHRQWHARLRRLPIATYLEIVARVASDECPNRFRHASTDAQGAVFAGIV